MVEEPNVWDLVGVGFGPSNLALAAAIEEELDALRGGPLSHLFLERKADFAWHPGMLLPGARIQLTFLKDLVTLRNPRSRFTFLCYLQDRGRLDKFVNLRNFFPTRAEFNDYYRWAADQLRSRVRYGRDVLSITAVPPFDGTAVELLRIRVRSLASGEEMEVFARNLVLATGGSPARPPGLRDVSSSRLFHYEDFLPRIESEFPDHDGAHRFVVVGSGQTAAELFHYLLTTYPRARITAALRRFAYKPADDSHFVNEIFFPQMIDFVYDLPETKRKALFESHADTNYSAVDLDLIQEIYELLYEESVRREGRAEIRPFLELVSAQERRDSVRLQFRDLSRDRPVSMEADAAILATGVARPRKHPLLRDLAPFLVADGADGYRVSRNYEVETEPDFLPRIYLQGYCESTHGISDTLLSALPARAMEIVESLVGERDGAGATGGKEGRDEERSVLRSEMGAGRLRPTPALQEE